MWLPMNADTFIMYVVFLALFSILSTQIIEHLKYFMFTLFLPLDEKNMNAAVSSLTSTLTAFHNILSHNNWTKTKQTWLLMRLITRLLQQYQKLVEC